MLRLLPLLLLLSAAPVACDDAGTDGRPDRYVVGVLMNLGEGGDLAEMAFVADKINRLGGVLGAVPLELRAIDITGMAVWQAVAAAEQLLGDPEVVAIIGPETAGQMMAIAPRAIKAEKPLIAYKPSSSDILRAFGGSPFIWRTKPADIFQIEWIVRQAWAESAPSIGIVASVESGAQSAFDWFGFTARNLGFTDAQLHIETFGAQRSCLEAVEAMIALNPERMVVAATESADLTCIVEALHANRLPDGTHPTRVIVADLGPDLASDLAVLQHSALGLEGWISTHHPETGLDEEYAAFAGSDAEVPTGAASGHDALLVIVHGLEVSRGQGGLALAEGIQTAVTGQGTAHGPHADGLRNSLAALRAGEPVDLVGATGALAFDPDAGLDLVAGTLGYWRTHPEVPGPLMIEAYVDIGGPMGEPAPDLLALASQSSYLAPEGPAADAFVPLTPAPTRAKALLVVTSSGFENYRHQADALARYQRLKAAGLTDDDIILVAADDIASHPDNALPGVVRNVPGGPDVYAGAIHDYDLSIGAAGIVSILSGAIGPDTPTVLELDAGTNLYVYFAGHGGITGMAMGAQTLEDGLTGGGLEILTPEAVRDALCALRASGQARRIFVEIESCYAGVFGDADFFGVESGCPDGPLTGVTTMTAAGTRENSLGTGYDLELRSWVGNEFSRKMLARIDQGDDPTVLDLYRDVYLNVSGSHAQLYNSRYLGDIETIRISEFLSSATAPPPDDGDDDDDDD